MVPLEAPPLSPSPFPCSPFSPSSAPFRRYSFLLISTHFCSIPVSAIDFFRNRFCPIFRLELIENRPILASTIVFRRNFSVFVVLFLFQLGLALDDGDNGNDSTVVALCGALSPEFDESDELNEEDGNHSTVPPIALGASMGDILQEATWRREHVAALPQVGSTAKLQLFGNSTKIKTDRLRCTLRIDACAACKLRIDYTPPGQYLSFLQIGMYSSCISSAANCLDVRFVEDRADWVLDSPYSVHQVLPSANGSFTSTGPSLRILATIFHDENATNLVDYLKVLFPMKITVLNASEAIGGAARSIETAVGYINSPRYPSAYPRSIEKKWILQNEDPKGFIRLIFDDFQVHFQSDFRIIDSDGKELISTRKTFRRPPAIVSAGARLEIQLNARDFTQTIGFRARYEFVEHRHWPDKPSDNNCDEVFEGYGGQISWENWVADEALVGSFIDCVWIVGRLGRRVFDRMYLKVEEFDVSGIGVQLEIREGPTSIGERLLLLNGPQPSDQLAHRQPRHGFTSSLSQPAFYIRFRGFLIETNGLNIAYAQYYRWATALCPSVAEWHCDNSRCIKASLRCDGVDHCGDGSDEGCDLQETSHIASRSSEDTTHLALFVVSACALLILLLVATGFASRVFRNRLSQHSAQPPNISTIGSDSGPFDGMSPSQSGLAPMMTTVGQRRFYVAPLNDLTVVEAPPTYDDALKHPQVNANSSIPTIAYTNRAFVQAEATSDDPQPSTAQTRAEIVTDQPGGEHFDPENSSNEKSRPSTEWPSEESPRIERDLTSIRQDSEEVGEEEAEEELGSWV